MSCGLVKGGFVGNKPDPAVSQSCSVRMATVMQ